jgi:hypothetical protein
MTRVQRKPKAGSQKAKVRKKPSVVQDQGAAGGTMTGIRGVLKKASSTSAKKKTKTTAAKVVDIAIWIALAVAIAFWLRKQFA